MVWLVSGRVYHSVYLSWKTIKARMTARRIFRTSEARMGCMTKAAYAIESMNLAFSTWNLDYGFHGAFVPLRLSFISWIVVCAK